MGCLSKDGLEIAQTEIVPTPQDFEQGLQAIKAVADKLCNGEKIDKIAGGIAGPLDREKSKLISSPHIPSWVDKPFKNRLEEMFNAPVYLDNDSKLVALGEANVGAGKGSHIVSYIGLGTGVGGSRITGGKIDENTLGFEPGHQIIMPDGNNCNCGGKGHLEAYVSGAYFEELYGQRGENIKDPKVWEEVARFLAIGLNNTLVHWSPDILVLGGSVMNSVPLESVKNNLKQIVTIFPTLPEVVLGSLGDSAGLYGALELIKQS